MKGIFVALLMTVLSTAAQAERQTLEIDMGDVVLQTQGFNDVKSIPLKQALKDTYPELRGELRDAELVAVRARAKSKKGRSQMALEIGRDLASDIVQVEEGRTAFRTNNGMNAIVMKNKIDSQGAWKLIYRTRPNDKIKLKKLIVVIKMAEPMVTRECGYVREFFWGMDVKKYVRKATGARGSGVLSKACQKAKRACERDLEQLQICQKLN